MANKKFTDEEIQILKANKYTFNVTHNSIRFTTEFKQLFFNKLNEGNTPLSIIEDFGYSIEMLGSKRIAGIALHTREEFRVNGCFHEGRRLSTIENQLENKEITPSKALIIMQGRITYLEQQVEYLKKILKEVK